MSRTRWLVKKLKPLLKMISVNFLMGCTAISFFNESYINPKSRITSLKVEPDLVVLAIGNTKVFQASGGQAPYSYRILSGTGTVDSVTGLYSANGATGNVVIEITDAKGISTQATITVNAAMAVSASTVVQRGYPGLVQPIEGSQLSGGVPPYSYRIVSGPGSIDAVTGIYTFPNSQLPTQVRITDAIGNSVDIGIENQPSYTNGTITAVAVDGSNAYIGGSFNRVWPNYTPSAVIIQETNGAVAPMDCNYSKKLNSGAQVYAAIRDGNYLFLAGDLSTFGGATIGHLIKINLTECALVNSFTPAASVNGEVRTLELSGDNLYVGGDFTTYRGSPQPYLLKLSRITGESDATFNPGTSVNGSVDSVVYSAGFLFVGGDFTTYRGSPAERLAKIDAITGALDTTFTQATGLYASIEELFVQGAWLFVCASSMSTYRGAAVHDRIIKLDLTTGLLDNSFVVTLGFPSKCLDITADGASLYIAGEYESIDDGTITQNSKHLGKVSLVNGAIDVSFSQVSGLVGQSVGANSILYLNNFVYVSSGSVTDIYRGERVASFFRVDSNNGDLDTTYTRNVALNKPARIIHDLGGGNILLGGYFTFFAGQFAEGLAKMDLATKVFDVNFSSNGGLDSAPNSLLVQGGSLYMGGAFTTYRSSPANMIAKIDLSSGNLDTTFTQATGFSGSSGTVYEMIYANSSLYVAGQFTTYRGSPANGVAKINPTSGVLDTTFTQATGVGRAIGIGYAKSLATDGASAIFISGYFNRYRGATVQNLAKLNWTNGNLDGGFTQATALNGAFGFAIGNNLKFSGGSVYVGGDFTLYRGATAQRIVKLNPTNGNLDPSFTQATGYSGTVDKLFSDGVSLYATGGGTTYRGANVFGLTKLNPATGDLDLGFQSTSGFLSAPTDLFFEGGSSITTFGGCNYRSVSVCQIIQLNKSTGELQY